MLELSPDWDARFCYVLVLLCALVSARVQVYGRLSILKEKIIYAWSIPSTWFVFTIYLLIPVGLFWLLDRSGALRDTSLFSALLVGFAYPAILSGSTSVKAGEGITSVLGWLNTATDSLADKVLAHVAIRDRIFRREVATRVAASPDGFGKLKEVALTYSDDSTKLDAELSGESDPHKRAAILYDYATASVEGLKPIHQILPDLAIPRNRSPLSKARRAARWYVLVLFVVAATMLGWAFSSPGHRWISVWRIVKHGTSETDLHRVRHDLDSRMAIPGGERTQFRVVLAAALQTPGLDVRRVDEILSVLLRYRGDPKGDDLLSTANLLTDAIRVSSVDVRARIHLALILLAEEHLGSNLEALNTLREWEPLASDSAIDLERKWRAWQQFWLAAKSQQ